MRDLGPLRVSWWHSHRWYVLGRWLALVLYVATLLLVLCGVSGQGSEIMFNSPRAGQRYVGISPSGLGGSFVDENPLANSVYDDGLDPWSAAPSPSPTPAPHANSVFNAVIADASVPSIYHRAFSAVDPANLGETSVNSLSRVLATSSLPAATIDKIVNLVSSKPRVSKLEFFVALALVALAQQGKDVSIEQVAALSSQNTLPEPMLDLDRLQPSNSTFGPSTLRENIPPQPIRGYTVDPWSASTTKYPTLPAPGAYTTQTIGVAPASSTGSNLAGTGLPDFWWQKQATVRVTLLGHQGFILNRYIVYEITSEKSDHPVIRRYSEFTFLWDCLVRRYPFRLFPALPPKRIGADEQFLEQRRKGLTRALNFVVNHPIIKDDGILAAFLTEISFETWRKNSSISLDEESVSKKVDKVEEMSIPSDFDEKVASIRGRLNPLIDHWQRICILAERIIKRQEAAAVRLAPALRKTFLPTHFALPPLSPSLSVTSLPGSPSASMTHSLSMSQSLSHSLFGLQPIESIPEPQSDLSRLTNTLRAVTEVGDPCWRGDDCELSNGIRIGLGQVAEHTQRQSELSENRTRVLLDTTLEDLKSQRDLYLATRDLFIRHERLSVDQVERLKKRVEANSIKLDGIRSAQKEGWQEEADRLTAVVERDQATIAAQLSRRVFIRVCLWHELRVILHNRENTLVTQAVHGFARAERNYSESVANIWQSLEEQTEGMPYE
ncbi:MVP1 domain-containing protein [Coprinopsis marcescibilis]|uniref:Sorting nexin MVP1 n=1 Tax=Coprinopsis marcescibilis TaxID=230819 RepID=A0A5C3LAL4_COPMA|nr:MVP1 domain-containing protein [Coprinopsis marcescibilis]